MSSRSRKLISHMVIILFFAIVAGVVAYGVGSIFGRSAIAGHEITLNAWKGAYRNLTIFVGFFTWVITCTWYWCAYSVFSIKNPIGVGKRVFWGICGATVAGICIVSPIVYAIFSKVFAILNNESYNVQMISYGASKVNISFILEDSEVEDCIRLLHKEFFD